MHKFDSKMEPMVKNVTKINLIVTKWDACHMFQGENVFDVL